MEAYLSLQDFAKALPLAPKELEPLADLTLEERALVARCYFHSPDPKHLPKTVDLLVINLRNNRYHHPSLLIMAALLPRLPRYEDLNYVMNRIPGIRVGGPEYVGGPGFFTGQLGRQGGKLTTCCTCSRNTAATSGRTAPGNSWAWPGWPRSWTTGRPRSNTTAGLEAAAQRPTSPNCCCSARCPGRIGARP